MKVKTEELKSVIKVLLPATSKKDLVLQMAHLVFQENEILAYNDRIAIAHPFESGITASVPAESLNKILDGIEDKEIELSADDNNLTITSKSTEAVIQIETEYRVVEEYFSEVDFDAMEWGDVPQDFLDNMALARLSTSSNALDPNNLYCVYVNKECLDSSDGYRVSRIFMESDFEDSFLLPSSSIQDLLTFKSFESYSLEDSWIHFTTDNEVTVSCRTGAGDFPDFTEIIDGFEKESEIKIDTKLIPALENLSGLVEGESDFMKSVNIELKAKKAIITGRKEGVSVKKSYDVENSGTATFDISPVFLAYILKLTNNMAIGEHSALFEDNDKFIHLVQLPV